jgi:glycerol-1-phosphate dehydrogenase [NAD(P)+]
MTITGTSSPASGGEHLISHSLDMLAGRDGGSHDLHGRQVGVASILMAALYEEVLAVERPVFRAVPQQIDTGFWGSLSPVVAAEYQQKLPRFQEVADRLSQPEGWQELRQRLRTDLVPAAKLKNCLAKAGAAHRIGDISFAGAPLGRGEFLAVVAHANQMRARYTVLDLAAQLGILPAGLADLVDRWLA